MKRLLAVAALAAACGAAMAVEVTDDRGKPLHLPKDAERLVALAPHLAEIAFAAGAGGRMVGISAHTRLPDGVVLPVVASSGQVDIERLLKLKPDAVLGWTSGNSRAQIERLERLGLAVVVTEVHVPADIPRITRLVGLLAGTPGAAEEAARGLEREISSLGRAARERPTPVFVEIWHQPLMTVNGAHLISQLVSTCGGRNVFAGARALTPVISREALLVASPEVVIVGAAPGEKQSVTRWRDVAVPAARSGRVHAIDPHLLHGLGPGALVAARQICAAIGTSA